jgi:hypothetical protein
MSEFPKSILDWPGVGPKDHSVREKVLRTALYITTGDRNRDYGDPTANFTETARIASDLLGLRVEPREAVLFMIAVKLGRLLRNPHHADSIVDLVAYCAIFAEVVACTHEGGARPLDPAAPVAPTAPGAFNAAGG